MSNRIDSMREKITTALNPTHLEIIDDSADHYGHAGSANGAGHYTVKVASATFQDKSPVACHRLIYHALGDMMKDEIHALRIEIL